VTPVVIASRRGKTVAMQAGTRFLSRVFLLTLLFGAQALLADDWRSSAQKSGPAHPGDVIVNASPGIVAVDATSYGSIAGDDDGFGFGSGWNPPSSCEVFDNREPEDLGVFDQRRPGSAYNSICNFSGSWVQPLNIPPGGAGQVTLSLRILGGQGSTAFCFASPCGCETPSQQITINGTPEPFFGDPGCATTTVWSKTWQGNAANALGNSLALSVVWGNNAFAIDYSRATVLPVVEVAVLDGNDQKGAISNIVEKKLRVKFTTPDPNFDLSSLGATFEVTGVPPNASGAALGPNEAGAVSTTYTAPVDANGIASATLLLGSKAGAYTVTVKSPLSLTGASAVFTETAVKPASVVLLKDSTDLADKALTYAVASDEPTPFFALGLDSAGARLGPVKCNWSWSASGSAATRGEGSLAPADVTSTTTFSPSKVGHLLLQGNPIISGVGTAKAELYITQLYVSLEGQTFLVTAPEDHAKDFVPGQKIDNSDYPLSTMNGAGQPVTLHVLTGPGAKGTVTFNVASSAYPGIAMNYPIPVAIGDGYDMLFENGTASIAVPFSAGGDTTAKLMVRDYGASGTISVEVKAGKNLYTIKSLRLPVMSNGNGLPIAGWYVGSTHIDATALTAEGDVDDSAPSASLGDGFSNYEEMRGFFASGNFTRLDPKKKDVFIDADDQVLTLWNGKTIVDTLPLTTHYISQIEDSGLTIGRATRAAPIVDPNRAGIPGVREVGGQRAVRMIFQSSTEPVYSDYVSGTDYPAHRVFLFGIAIPDGLADTFHLNSALNADQSLNGPGHMQWMEVFPQSFANVGLKTDFSRVYLDAFGNPVPDCALVDPAVTRCDDWLNFLGLDIIVPHKFEITIFDPDPANPTGMQLIRYGDRWSELDLARYPGIEFYSKINTDCGSVMHSLTYDEMEKLKTMTVAHEFGHCLGMPHLSGCTNIMARGAASNYPLANSYDTFFNISNIKLKP